MKNKNIDKYGHCVICHRNLIIERVVDGIVMNVFLPEKEETQFLLDDGSRMRVCICRDCKTEANLNDESTQIEIMEAVIAGWQLEVDEMVKEGKWVKEKGSEHMSKYKTRNILIHADSVSEQVVHRKRKELLKKLEEPKKEH